MMPDQIVKIRDASEQDIERIMELEHGSIVHPWVRSEFERLISDDGKLCLVAEKDSLIVGYIGAECVLDECNIGNIVTAREYRHTGIGTAVLNALLDELKGRGIVKVFLEVEFDNDPALALYDKTGFQRYGMRKDYYGPGMDAVLMCKNL